MTEVRHFVSRVFDECDGSVAFSLAPSQRGLWIAQNLAPRVPFNIAQYVEIHGALEIDLLVAATDRACRELSSPLLRMVDRGGEPFQVVDNTIDDALRYRDMRGYDNPVAAAHEWMTECYSHPLDLCADRLIGAVLLHVGPSHYFWFSYAHHLVLDGHGAMVLMNRVAEIYSHAVRGTEPPLSDALDLPTLYQVEDDYRHGTRFERDRQYWMHRLTGIPRPSRLTEREFGVKQPSLSIRHVIDDRVVTALAASADRWSSAQVPIVIAAFAAYLARVTGNAEIVLSLPVTGRTTAASKRSAGTLANVVPLRILVDSRASVIDLVRATQLELTGALRHQRFRYEDMKSSPGSDLGSPGFGPMINIMMYHRQILLGDVVGEFNVLTTGPVEDLSVCIYPGVAGQRIRVDFEANPLRYSADELDRHHARFLGYLEAFATAADEVVIGDLPVLTPAEHSALVMKQIPDTRRCEPLPDLLQRAATMKPDATDHRLGERATFAAIDRQSNRMARTLLRVGAGPDTRIAVLVHDPVDRLAAVWAVIRSGATIVAVGAADHRERIHRILAAARTEIAIAAEASDVPRAVVWIDSADRSGDATPVRDADRIRRVREADSAVVVYVRDARHGTAGLVVTRRGLAGALRNRGSADARPADPFDIIGVLDEFSSGVAEPADLLAPPNGHGGSDASALVLDRGIRPVPVGTRGELHLVVNDRAVRGFDGEPGPTAAAFVANPLGTPGSRMFRTGRLVRWNAEHTIESDSPAEHLDATATLEWDCEFCAPGSTAHVSADQAGSSEFAAAPAVCPVDVPAEIIDAVRELAFDRRTTVFTVVHATLAALLARRTGVDDVVIGTRVSTRQVGASTGTVVPLRSLVDERDRFVDMVKRIRDRDAVEFDDAMASDGEAVVPGGRVAQIGLWARSFGEPRDATGQFDVEVRIEDASPTSTAVPAISVAYRPRTVDLATVELLCRQLRALLLQVGTDPAVVVADLGFESRGVLHGPAGGDPRSLGEILAHTAERYPDRPALADGRVTLTYRDVDERSNRLAHKLIARGAQPGEVVAVLLPRSINLAIALWAVAKTGAAYLPLDGDQPTDRLEATLRTAAVETAIGEPPRDLMARLNIDWINVTAVDEDSSPVRVQSAVDEAAYVIFTSGSTGAPKGVVVTHRGLGALVGWAVDFYRVQPGSRVLQGYNCAFDAALLEVLLAVGGGACLIIAPDDMYAGIELQQFLVDQQVTHYLSTPAVLASVDPRQLPELQVVGVGGEALPTDLALRWSRDPGAPDRLLVNAYGPTEATVVATGAVVRDRVSIGVPVAGTSVLVLDARLRPVPTGGVGELYLFGSGLARGYLGSPAQTAERFVPNPVSPGRMYRTGDLVCQRADGLLDFVGRVDQQVKLHGQRIELGEIDEAVRAIADVDNVATVLRTSAAGTDVLVSYIVPRTDVDVERLLRRLGRVLPSYMVPSSVVILPEMPVSPTGKVDRGALPEPVVMTEEEFVPPRTQTEGLIATLMADLLDRERVGLHDSFVALGGDSIMALDLAARARRHGVVISARDVLDRTTVGDIAALAEVAARADMPTSPPELDGADEGRLPLPPIARFMFERGGSITQLSQSMLLTLSPAATHDEIAVTIEAVIDHHAMLRSRLVAVPDDVDELQVLAPGTIDARALLHRVPLDPQLSEPAVRDFVATQLAAAVERLDPSQAVMSQWIWFDFGQVRPGLMLVVAHHLVVDAVSWRILVQDLIMAGGQLAGGVRIALPQVGTSTRRWARTLAEEARSGARRDELPVWLTIVGRHDPPMGRRHLDPAVDVGSTVQTFAVTASAATTRSLLTSVPASAHCGTDEVLLTALGLAVTSHRRARDVDASSVLVHVERHGRDESLVPGTDLTRTVGWFTTAHPVRIALRTVDLADADAIGAALAAVKEQLRAVPDHGIGYGMLRYWDPGGAVLRDRPFGQIGFNYLGWATLGGQVRKGTGGGWLPVIDPDRFVVPVVPDMPVRVPLQIDAIVLDAGDGPRLTVWFGFASGVLAESDVRELAQRWTAALDALAAHSTPPGGGATHQSVPAVAAVPTDIDVRSPRYGSTASRSCRPPRRHGVGSKKGSQ